MSKPVIQSRRTQSGLMLLEVLISILIFAIGILAIVALQAVSIKNAGDAKYRSDASLLTNHLIGRMWADNRTSGALSVNFSSPNGPLYLAWLNDITANSTLPGIAANPPIVTVAAVPGGSAADTPSSLVTITLFWKAPEEPASAAPHKYVAVAQIH